MSRCQSIALFRFIAIEIVTLLCAAGCGRIASSSAKTNVPPTPFIEENRDATDLTALFGPLRHQTAGNCFANVGADLIGASLKISPDQQISALDVASQNYLMDPAAVSKLVVPLASSLMHGNAEAANILFNNLQMQGLQLTLFFHDKPLSERNGGTIEGSILSYNYAGGSCLESRLHSDPSEEHDRDFVHDFLRGLEIKAQQNLDSGILTETLVNDENAENFERKLQVAKSSIINSNWTLATTYTFDDAYSKSLIKTVDRAVAQEIDAICTPRKPVPLLIPQTFSSRVAQSKQTMVQKVSSLLSSGHPVGISFHACFLLPDEKAKNLGECGHAAIFVAKRCDAGRTNCQYKLRNSWGHRCEVYNMSIRDRCEDGYIWLTEREIEIHVDKLVWL